MHWLKTCQMVILNIYHKISGDLSELIKQKGVYLYEYMDSFKKFSEDELPNRCEFFSSLKDEYISKKDYLHDINVWNVFVG